MPNKWTIKDVVGWTTRFFTTKGIPEPRLEADLLLAWALQRDRVFLYANYDLPLTLEEREKYKQLIIRRAQKEPLAYIIGRKEFMSLEFTVTPAVLIPRPETELLVDTALTLAGKDVINRICDVGTGSGCIAVSLACYLPAAVVVAADISAPALAVARQNADLHGVAVDFLLGDLLQPCRQLEKFDLITANLPYIAPDQYRKLDESVKNYEPSQALVAGGDGLDLYRRLVPQSYEQLSSGGYMLFEISPEQVDEALQITRPLFVSEALKDMAGRWRLIKCRKE